MFSTAGGATVNDWTSYAAVYDTAGGGAIGDGNVQAQWRRIGDSVQIYARITFGSTSTFGTGPGDPFRLTIPPGLTRDSTKILSTANYVSSDVYFNDSSTPTNNLGGGQVYIASGASLMTFMSPGTATATCSSVPFTWATGDVIDLTCIIPVAEYSGGQGQSASISPSTLSGDVNDYNPTGLSTTNFVRINGGAADRNITGLQAPSLSGVVTLVNVGTTNNLVLKNQSGSSSATNRFLTAGGTDVTLTPGASAACWYDPTTTRWRVGSAGGGGGGFTIESISTTSTVSATNRVVSITAGGITVSVPASPSSGDYLYLKDTNGNATASNIVISGNGHNIDGSSTLTFTTNYSALFIVYNGSTTSWMIL